MKKISGVELKEDTVMAKRISHRGEESFIPVKRRRYVPTNQEIVEKRVSYREIETPVTNVISTPQTNVIERRISYTP